MPRCLRLSFAPRPWSFPPVPSAAQLDHAHVWHPFTQMRDWLRAEPIVIRSGRGAVLRDTRGRT